MLDFVIGSLARCRTANDARRVQVTLANELAPAEVAMLAKALRERYAGTYASTVHWLGGLESLIGLSAARPQPFERSVLAPGVFRYAAPAGRSELGRRTLIVAFTGAAFRLMLPIACVLQNLDASRHDLVLLFDRARTQFLKGVPGIASDLPALLRRLDELAAFGLYRRVVFVGTSAGGLPAMRAAIEIAAERGIGIAASVPADLPSRVQTHDVDPAPHVEAFARYDRGATRLACVCASGHARDRANARWYEAHAGATVVEVPGIDGHNVLQQVFEAGELAPFLAELVDGDGRIAVPPGVAVGRAGRGGV